MNHDKLSKHKRNYSEVAAPNHVKGKIRRQDYDIKSKDDKNEKIEEGGGDTEAEETEPNHKKRHITHGYHLVEGKMRHGMEDYLVAEKKKINGHELALYAIFDGHSGREVAEYLKTHLFDNILDQPDFWENPKAAVKRAYESTDREILENVVGSRGGSTAVTAILIDGKKLIVANVGDSRAVLCINGDAKQITVDHEPEREKDLVESKGGFVSQKEGNVARVDGQLAMTRAFGDAKVKDHISVIPHVVVKKLDEDVDFLILASDGIWKVMSNEEATKCIKGLENGKEAAEELIKEALVRDSRDDLSCVVVMFH